VPINCPMSVFESVDSLQRLAFCRGTRVRQLCRVALDPKFDTTIRIPATIRRKHLG
jgi:hypothetical protein